MRHTAMFISICMVTSVVLVALPALSGPLTFRGTQPIITNEILSSSDCSGCHGDFDSRNHIEPWPTWVGSMMANSARDPIFWAALDVANHDLPGAGDFCLRCHTPGPWLAGLSEPPGGTTDGCALTGSVDELHSDFEGINCHFCHRMMINPSPPPGESAFYLENGIAWIDDGECSGEPCRYGPYDYPLDGTEPPPHEWDFAAYTESSDFCGNCHNVTNPVRNLIDGGVDTGILFPIERTYDEWLNSDYSDATSSDFSTCQNCHMPDATVSPAYVCDDMINNHSGDYPIHVLAGGNSWVPEVLRQEYPDLDVATELAATRDAAEDMLTVDAASLELTAPATVTEGTDLALSVRVTNHAGHKLPTGYAEGRRMWLQVEVRDSGGSVVFESGAYATATGTLTEDGQIKIYRAEQGIWNHLGTGGCDIADGAGNPIFHFVLNDCVLLDNRIPPLGFTGGTDVELEPVGYTYPETAPGSGVLVNYDETPYAAPIPGGTTGPLDVTVRLLYQTASREYVEFLRDEAVTHGFPDDCVERASGPATQSRGEILHDMWRTRGRSAPVEMASDTATVVIEAAPYCGDGTVDPGETCDPPTSCPTTCDDSDACTTDTLTGDAAACTSECTHDPITACSDGDGCCPTGCDAITDDDCAPICGNLVVEPGETCDPPSSCPTCDDGAACTEDSIAGSAATCDVVCSATPITACADGDGCCPAGCDASGDDDCSASCGDSIVDPGETCDPPDTCPTGCDDGAACTEDRMTGSPTNCNVACSYSAITACVDGDGCCPAGCDASGDDDCPANCGDSIIDPGETCDPPETCPTECDDDIACTVDTLSGSAVNCTAACSHAAISACADGDGCCPAGCDSTVDDDCSTTCGDSVVDPGETCDPPETCPTECDDRDGCTIDFLTGSAATCSAECSHTDITECHADDGCCPPGCDESVDADCSGECGDGVVDPVETCDPPESCPTDCDDGDACTLDTLIGAAETCTALCDFESITACEDGDGCCPDGCDDATDDDCGGAASESGCNCRLAVGAADARSSRIRRVVLGLWFQGAIGREQPYACGRPLR